MRKASRFMPPISPSPVRWPGRCFLAVIGAALLCSLWAYPLAVGGSAFVVFVLGSLVAALGRREAVRMARMA